MQDLWKDTQNDGMRQCHSRMISDNADGTSLRRVDRHEELGNVVARIILDVVAYRSIQRM